MSTLTGNRLVKPHLGKSLLIVAAVAAAIVMIPLVAMQFTSEVAWTASDFVVAGVLLAVAGLVLGTALRHESLHTEFNLSYEQIADIAQVSVAGLGRWRKRDKATAKPSPPC